MTIKAGALPARGWQQVTTRFIRIVNKCVQNPAYAAGWLICLYIEGVEDNSTLQSFTGPDPIMNFNNTQAPHRSKQQIWEASRARIAELEAQLETQYALNAYTREALTRSMSRERITLAAAKNTAKDIWTETVLAWQDLGKLLRATERTLDNAIEAVFLPIIK